MTGLDDLVRAHVELSQTLRDTHYGHHLRVLHSVPSVVEFARAVGTSTPLLIKGAAKTWPAMTTRRWTNAYLARVLGDRLVTVSLTGDGFADAVRWVPDYGTDASHNKVASDVGNYRFVSAYEVQVPFAPLLEYMTVRKHVDCERDESSELNGDALNACSAASTAHASKTVAFCQLQNDCLRSREYMDLMNDVPEVLAPWAEPVLGNQPEALNFWMGTKDSVTTMHSDSFDNIYTVIRGTKVFTLYPPCDAFFFDKRSVFTGRWLPQESYKSSNGELIPPVVLTAMSRESQDLESTSSQVPWIPLTRPNKPVPGMCPHLKMAPKPFEARVEAGDSLYLPKGWLHHVEQEEDDGGVCIAVNAWYGGWEGMGPSWGWLEYAETVREIISGL